MKTSAPELQKDLIVALDNLARDPERAPDYHIDLGKLARQLPTEVVDQATADALRQLLSKRRPDDPSCSTIFISTEQFAYEAGADRFDRHTRRMINFFLSEKIKPNSQYKDANVAEARAHLYDLRRATGQPATLSDIQNESSMLQFLPGLWFDLALGELPTDSFLHQLNESLYSRSLIPGEILPRLKSITRTHGAQTAQLALNLCCQFYHQFGEYDEAISLLERAESIHPVGWTMPCEDEPYKGYIGYKNADEIMPNFEKDITTSSAPELVFQRYRIIFIPFFSATKYINDMNDMNKFMNIASSHLDAKAFFELATSENYQILDQNGRDWFSSLALPNLHRLTSDDFYDRQLPFPPPIRKPTYHGELGKLLANAGFA